MARISVRTLGTVSIEVGRRIIGPSAGRSFALLLYLSCQRGLATPRRMLQELLFPRIDERRAGHSLRQLIYRLRQLGVPIAADDDGVEIAGEDVWVDSADVLERGELGGPDLELIARGLFPGYSPEISEGYREWFEGKRNEVRVKLSGAIVSQLTQLKGAGRWDVVDLAGRALQALDPLSEEGALARAEALAASGSKSAALRVIDEYLKEIGDDQPNLRLTPTALRRRISERLPEMGHRAQEDRIFVGREDTMRILSAAGAAARAGNQQTVLVWGESGIGKTRLLAEYKALACLRGALAFELTCQPHDVFRPLGILSDLVGQLLQAPGALGCDPDARKMLTRLVTAETAAEQTTDQSALSSITSAIEDLVSAISVEAPLTILVDDAQWLDKNSLRAILAALSTKAAARRTCLVLASRDRLPLANNEGLADSVLSVRLNPLAYEAALELVRGVMRARQNTNAELEQQIVSQGRGNPFFIRTLCLHLSSAEDANSLGQTVLQILARRLEQLTPESMRVLEGCAILGKNCTFGRLEKLLAITRLALLRALEELDDKGLIELRDGCFVSSHGLLSQAVIQRMSRSVFRVLHSAAATILQLESGSSPAGSLPWDCAEHWRLAGDHSQAIAVLRTCARRALEIGRATDAFATLRRALAMPSPDSTRLEIIESALNMLWLGVNWVEGKELFPELKRLRRNLGLLVDAHDDHEMAEFAGALHGNCGDPRMNVTRLRRCLCGEGLSVKHRLAAARQLIMIAELTVDRELAEFAFCHSRALAPGSHRQLLCDLLYHTCFGDRTIAAEIAAELVRPSTDEYPHVTWFLNAGYAQYRIGDPAVAEQILLEGFATAEKYRSLSRAMNAALMLARLYWSVERFEESIFWHSRYSELQLQNDDPNVVGEHSVLGAHIALRDGRLDLAKSCIAVGRGFIHAQLDLPRLFLSACDIEVALLEGDNSRVEELLEDALPLHLRARNIGCQDDVTFSVVRALECCGRADEAVEILNDYLAKHRRDGFPVPSSLRMLKSRLMHDVTGAETKLVMQSREGHVVG